MPVPKKIAALAALAALALIPGAAQAQQTRPSITVAGVPDRISGQPVDWSVAVGDLDDQVVYTLTIDLPDGLALDVGCTLHSRTYVIAEASTYSAPPGDEVLRLFPCRAGEHTYLVTLQAEDTETVRREVVIHVDQVNSPSAVEDGFLSQPSVAVILGARRYGDVVLVIYHVDYPDVAVLPPAADAWWLDGQVGGVRSVSSAQAIAYTRGGWGHGLLALRHSDTITQVRLMGMPGRYAEPLDVTEPVVTGANLGADLVLALRGLQTMPEWQDQELVVGEWLGQDGMAYAETLLPNLRDLAPEVYSSSIVALSRTSFTPTKRTDQGVLPIDATSSMTGAGARVTRLGEVMFRLAMTTILAVIAAAVAIKLGKSGLLAVPSVILVMLGGTIAGFVPLALMLTIGLLGAIIGGFALFGKRA